MTAKIHPGAMLNAAKTQAASGDSNNLAGSLKKAAAAGDAEGIREAAQKFEGFFVQMMLKEMRKAQSSEGGLFSGTEMETFNDLFDQEIAERVSEGRGIGLASQIMRSLVGENGIPGSVSSLGTASTATPVHVPAQVFGGPEGRFAWPLPKTEPGRISSNFGGRVHPVLGGHHHHKGLDIAAPAGTPVLSMAAGTVVRADKSSSYGNVVYVDHGDGVVTRYAHQERLDVEEGQRVVRGQQLGTVGSTGRSTGNHLHLEVRVSGKAVDPQDFLGQAGY